MKPVVPIEQFADLAFPDQGMDLALGFGVQRDGTTRSGQNVRAYEPAEQRERGGSRQGLKQYVPDLVGGVHLVQHLNYVVDPEAFGFVDYDPPGGVTGGPNPSGGGPTGDGTYPDPTGPPRVTVPRTIRFGGTGLTLSRKRKSTTYGYGFYFAWSEIAPDVVFASWNWTLALNGAQIDSGSEPGSGVGTPADAHGYTDDAGFVAEIPADNPQPSSDLNYAAALLVGGVNALTLATSAGGNSGNIIVRRFLFSGGVWTFDSTLLSTGWSQSAPQTHDYNFTVP